MFVAECFPGTVSFNTGAPFQPFSRNPQMRFSYNLKGLKFIATAFSQRDFTSNGPDGTSSKYLRNARVPNIDFQIQFNPDSTEHVFGIGVDYKMNTPRLYSEITETAAVTTVDTLTWATKVTPAVTKKYAVNENIASLSAIAFAKLKFKPITIKLEGVYAQNAYDMSMIGGYAAMNFKDVATGELNYTNITTGSVWLDLTTNGKKIQVGLFAGYTKNLGSNDTIKTSKLALYTRGANATATTYIDNVYRVSPRIVFISGKLDIAFELEYTVASYGDIKTNTKLEVTNGKPVSNIRGLLAFTYKF
ncbi:MAG: hypothetical protein WCK02_12950 [Bacteroidota bacterium]